MLLDLISPAGEPRPSCPARWRLGSPEALHGTPEAAVLAPLPVCSCATKGRRVHLSANDRRKASGRQYGGNDLSQQLCYVARSLRPLQSQRGRAHGKTLTYASFLCYCGIMFRPDSWTLRKQSKLPALVLLCSMKYFNRYVFCWRNRKQSPSFTEVGTNQDFKRCQKKRSSSTAL